jgi:hypothetical protein
MYELISNIISGIFGASMAYLMIKPSPDFVYIKKDNISQFAELYFEIDIDDAKLLNI